MRALLDEGVPKDVVLLLRERGLEASKFPNAWKGLRNGELLRRMTESGFDGLVTCDKNLLHQQNATGLSISIIVLPTQDLPKLTLIADSIATAFVQVRPELPLMVYQDGDIRRFRAGTAKKK